MSKELQLFYNELQAWIQGGQRDHFIFSWRHSLCPALSQWVRTKGLGGTIYSKLEEELSLQFKNAGLSPVFPFNEKTFYHTEVTERTHYNNPFRLKWIKEHAQT